MYYALNFMYIFNWAINLLCQKSQHIEKGRLTFFQGSVAESGELLRPKKRGVGKNVVKRNRGGKFVCFWPISSVARNYGLKSN